MLLRTRLSMLAAGVVACCATATAVLPTQAFAAPPVATAAPVPAPTATGPVGLTAPTVPTGSEDLAKPAAALPPALIGATRLNDPAEAGAPAKFKSLAVQSCTPADFAARTGADLVAFVKSSTVDCVKSLYSSGSADASIFQQSRMLSVAAALKDLAAKLRR